jgi:hypothetical protein
MLIPSLLLKVVSWLVQLSRWKRAIYLKVYRALLEQAEGKTRCLINTSDEYIVTIYCFATCTHTQVIFHNKLHSCRSRRFASVLFMSLKTKITSVHFENLKQNLCLHTLKTSTPSLRLFSVETKPPDTSKRQSACVHKSWLPHLSLTGLILKLRRSLTFILANQLLALVLPGNK